MKEERPWGGFEVLLDEPHYKVKKITLKPNKKISLQYHLEREEYWVVVSGFGKIFIEGDKCDLEPGTMWNIKSQEVHRATAGPEGLEFIEVQTGKCYEEDIVRLEDDYGRISE